MTEDDIKTAARLLADAERRRTPVDVIQPPVTDLASAYRVRDEGHRLHGERLAAWKVGVTNEAAQRFLELSEPVVGRVRESHVLVAPARIRVDEFPTPPALEVEFGFRMLAGHSGRASDPIDLAEIVDVVAAIEVVAGRVSTFPMLAAPDLVADNVVAARIVLGPSLGLDAAAIRSLEATPVSLEIDGMTVAEGTGAAALGHPLRVLGWLAEHAADAGTPLRAGDLVITGTCTGMTPAQAGSLHRARVGDVHLDLEVR